ncbi:hypothetical protein M406DRAFT_330554 [Cryphonectria parasitica EP155]|uniref:Uncharacterized protein n=1 Tax=Cryphonectria parasitica (strain ATCC 38755 / EP155) TaxID=660469 RepID=A0A9P4Y035_CRYP1|nr:uncharacterized protein M406DRAFT_330554 [Cryphonectria parasitica EP155]KAF3764203.1 hypothetical protein M406DRAFT_330554 [Cryphonectria parasitica EP155]
MAISNQNEREDVQLLTKKFANITLPAFTLKMLAQKEAEKMAKNPVATHVQTRKEVEMKKEPKQKQPKPKPAPKRKVQDRRQLLQKTESVTIAWGPTDMPNILLDDVNLAVLDHFAPILKERYYREDHAAATADGARYIMLPDSMTRVNVTGVKYVVHNMVKAIEKGNYRACWWTGDEKDTRRLVIRPRRSAVEMIHALYTLRAFGMVRDAEFLATPETGPIAAGLKGVARQWKGPAAGLRGFLGYLKRKILDVEDHCLVDGAWEAYKELAKVQRKAGKGTKVQSPPGLA